MGLELRVGAFSPIVADRNSRRAVQDQDLAFAADGVNQELGRLVAPLGGNRC